jgi:hypothetical protein
MCSLLASLVWLVLPLARPLAEALLRLVAPLVLPVIALASLVARLIPVAVAFVGIELLLELTLDPDLPREATLPLIAVIAAAWLFLRASWRQWRRHQGGGPPGVRQPFRG